MHRLHRHLDGRAVGKIRKNHMLEPVELRLDGIIDVLVAMAEQVRSPRAHDVEVPLAVNIVEPVGKMIPELQ